MPSAVKVVFLCGLTFLLAACKSQTPPAQVLPVDTKRIQTREFSEFIQAEGTLTNPGFIQFRPQVSGLITQVLVNEGDPVHKGQVLVVVDHSVQRADLETAQAQLKEAMIQAKRWSKLALVGGVEKEQAEEKQVKAIAAKSNMVAKQEALDKRYIRSPINGSVGDLLGVNPGQYLKEGENSFVIVNNKNLSIDLSVPATQASKIRLNQRVKMYDESSNDVIGEGRIDFIPPYFNVDKDYEPLNTIRVRGVFVNEKAGLRPNQLIRSKIIIGGKQYPGLPAIATLFKAQQPYTYKLIPIQAFLKNIDVEAQQKKSMAGLPPTTLIAVETPLKLGDLQDDYFPVLSGLEAGDLIPTSGSIMLFNGMPVSVKLKN